MNDPSSCPHCGADLQGSPIPEEHRQHYGKATHFSRAIGIVKYDRIDHWRCPDCGQEWSGGMVSDSGFRTTRAVKERNS